MSFANEAFIIIIKRGKLITPFIIIAILLFMFVHLGDASPRIGSYQPAFGTFIGRIRAYSTRISGQVYIVDERHLFIRNFRYERQGPDAHFWVGNEAQPSPKGQIVPYPPVQEGAGADGGTGVSSSRQVQASPPQNKYWNTRYNDEVDEDTAIIRRFQEINGIPVGEARRREMWRNRSRRRKLDYNNGEEGEIPAAIPKMKNENILLPLPKGIKVTDISYLSIWCLRFTVNYGEVYMPPNIMQIIPQSETLDQFPRSRSVLGSGRITILDTKSFYIPNFILNMMEPGYHFWAGNSPSGIPDRNGEMVANEKARFDDIKFYSGDDVIITLPKSLTVFDINYLAVFNNEISDNLGHIVFNISGLRIPPALGQTKKPGWWFDVPMTPSATKPPTLGTDEYKPFNASFQPTNCRELLGRKIRLMWENMGQYIYFRVKVHMDKNQFAAIGITTEGSPNIDADVVKIYYNETAKHYITQDSFLSKQLFCDFSDGLCADVAQSSGDNVEYMGSAMNPGLSIIDFKRMFPPNDMHDAPISMDGPTHIIVAIGSMQLRNSYFGQRHRQQQQQQRQYVPHGYPTTLSPYSQSLNLESENTTIDFSQTSFATSTCPNFDDQKVFPIDPEVSWEKSNFKARADDIMVARLGPTGGSKGYGAITGAYPPLDHSSVVWWINEKLLPEIYVERGKTYYFRVQGGDNSLSDESYHPLYITDNPEGGYIKKNPHEKRVETIYAGIQDSGGTVSPTGVGPLCEYVTSDGADRAQESETFEDYRNTLDLACEPGRENQYGWVNWTVQSDAPSLLFYQSFNGFGLGWKIHVINEGDPTSGGTHSMPTPFIIATLIMGIIA